MRQARYLAVPAVLLTVAATLGAASCGGSSGSPSTPSTATRFDAAERATSFAVNAALKSVRAVLSRALEQTGPSLPAGTRDVVLLPAAAADTTTCDAVTIQYFNATGAQQVYYNPVTTSRITARGTCTVSGVSTAVDLTFEEVQASSSTVLVNGTTTSSYEGLTVYGTARNLRVPRQSCAIPTSGEIDARIDDVTITVRFNGTSTVTGTYTRGGSSFTFQTTVTGC